MRKLALSLASILLLLVFGCATMPLQHVEQEILKIEEMEREFAAIRQSMTDRGYLTIDEFESLLPYVKKKYICISVAMSTNCVQCEKNKYPYHSFELYKTVSTAVINDYLPFKSIFYLALERENFDQAEELRITWVNCLQNIKDFLQKNASKVNKNTGQPRTVREFCYMTRAESDRPRMYIYPGNTPAGRQEKKDMIARIEHQIQKLTTVIGLTDPMLVTLRKELMLALKEKKWDDAQKIQSLTAARVNELNPPPQIVQMPNGQTTIIVPQQSSTKHVQVEQIPRYGATDVGRAITLLNGRGGRLTDKESGTLKLIDILLKR